MEQRRSEPVKMYHTTFLSFFLHYLTLPTSFVMIPSLVLGDADGNVEQAFSRIATINKSKAGPFHVVFCVGSFVKSPASENGEFKPYIEGSKAGPYHIHSIYIILIFSIRAYRHIYIIHSTSPNIFSGSAKWWRKQPTRMGQHHQTGYERFEVY